MAVKLERNVKKRVDSWLQGPFDAETKEEIQRLIHQNPKELTDAFFQDLSFGTGGMRGKMGIGTNRLNIYTIRQATQGLANYINKEPPASHSVFIGYDVRDYSRRFAEEAARVLSANGIKVFISREICPTPLASFACRYFGCTAAIMITASHNPPEYNGYKVYWSDGAQVVPPQDIGIIEEVRSAKEPLLVPLESTLIHWIGREIDAAYFLELKKLQLHTECAQSELKIIYSNLHGTGIRIIPTALSRWGFTKVSLVDAQSAPDGQFTNAPSPNPEEEKALSLGMEQLIATESDLLLATDPDADRLGIAVRDGKTAVALTGNQTACLCLYHLCTTLKEKGEFPENAAFVKTIVTTELFKEIAEDFGGTCIDVLTGFKYIGEQIRLWETSFEGLQYLFGAEESYGYLYGTSVRDKDAISASCLIAEAAAQAKMQGKTLLDRLHSIYRKYGVHRESLTSIAFPSSPAGMKQMQTLMKELRAHPPKKIGDLAVEKLEDYKSGRLSLPKSDVLRFWLTGETKLVIRPSGTEPKIKIYAEVVEKDARNLAPAIVACDAKLKTLIRDFQKQCID